MLLCGCVERQMTLVTRPEGAKAYYNNRYVGETPVTFHFTYYQDPALRFEMDGYQTLKVTQPVRTPWYERTPFDFFAETSVLTFRDRQTFSYNLLPEAMPDKKALVERADAMRAEEAPPK